jgi:molecular chaperone GrpE
MSDKTTVKGIHMHEFEHTNEKDRFEEDVRSADEDMYEENKEETDDAVTADCQHELESCQQKLQETEKRLLYLSSDFDNYRRNMTKEREQCKKESEQKILKELLPIVDDFSRAIADIKSEHVDESTQKRFEGIELLYKSLHKVLTSCDVHEITDVTTFDPNIHEAVMQVDDEQVASGNIVSVLQPGYTHRGMVIRPARVTVAA